MLIIPTVLCHEYLCVLFYLVCLGGLGEAGEKRGY